MPSSTQHSAYVHDRKSHEQYGIADVAEELLSHTRESTHKRPSMQVHCSNAESLCIQRTPSGIKTTPACADGPADSKVFIFSKVFAPSPKHGEVIAAFDKQHARFLKGQNITILAYGETGSGKTTTMTHLATAFAHGWMRALDHEPQSALHLCALEVDQEAVFDLLAAAPRQRRLDVWNSEAQKAIWCAVWQECTSQVSPLRLAHLKLSSCE